MQLSAAKILIAVAFIKISLLNPSQACAEVKYTLHLDGVDAAIATQISNAMNEAVALYNANGSFDKEIHAYYSAGVATANGNYNGTINFGGSRNTRVALHEIGHIMGVGQHSRYAGLMTDGTWDGATTNRLIADYDGAGNVLHGDSQHIWPYGLNYDTEYSATNAIRHIKVIEAMRCDMAIGPCRNNADWFEGPNRAIFNRGASASVIDIPDQKNTNGTNIRVFQDFGYSNQRWTVVHEGKGIYAIRSFMAGGRALDVTNGANLGGTNIQLYEYTQQNNQRFHIQEADIGWYEISPQFASDKCLAVNNGNVELASCNGSPAQQWKFVCTSFDCGSDSNISEPEVILPYAGSINNLWWLALLIFIARRRQL